MERTEIAGHYITRQARKEALRPISVMIANKVLLAAFATVADTHEKVVETIGIARQDHKLSFGHVVESLPLRALSLMLIGSYISGEQNTIQKPK